eukprot:763148-Hanusia_phi.AAC.2
MISLSDWVGACQCGHIGLRLAVSGCPAARPVPGGTAAVGFRDSRPSSTSSKASLSPGVSDLYSPSDTQTNLLTYYYCGYCDPIRR